MATGGTSTTTQSSDSPWSEDVTAVVTSSMLIIANVLAELPPKVALQLLEFCRRRIDAIEAAVLASRFEAGASERDVADMIRSGSNTSKAEAKKRASRGKATNANPDIANRMSEGTLSSEQADVIASAAEDTDGAAACDTDLLDEIAATTPEQGKKKARKYVNDRTKGGDVQDEHDKQHRNRTVYDYRTKDGAYVLAIQGDKTSVEQIKRSIDNQADIEYQNDGGRDVPQHKHPRTAEQRRFDAAAKILTGRTTPARQPSEDYSDPETGSAESDAAQSDAAPAAEGRAPDDNRAPADNRAGPASGAPPGQRRSIRDQRNADTIIVTATIDQLTGVDDTTITSADGKQLPRTVIDELSCTADFIGQIYSVDGELLWQGRRVRLATPAQITGLIARDGGCVECGAHYSRCVAHHIDPFEAPIQGETNIDRLVLLCDDCHHVLHQQKRTIYYERSSQSWKTRPARWEEIPPDSKPRPDQNRRNKYRTHVSSFDHSAPT